MARLMVNLTNSVRALFPQVFANGYVPIPNLDKQCRRPQWPSVRVDARQVDLWSRNRKWEAIGIRMEPPLLVADLDVLDAELVGMIEEYLPEDTMRRIGKPPKVAHFMRLKGGANYAFHRIATRRWAPDPKAEKPAWSAVEFFGGGGGGKQFGAFGPHSHDDDGNVLLTYQWDGDSPATRHIDTLPEISIETVYKIVNDAEKLFEERDWQYDRFTKAGRDSKVQVYDLTPEMRFVGEFRSYSLTELEIAARAARVKGDQIRLTGSFTHDPNSRNSLRCRVGISHHDRVYIRDFKTELTHHPADCAGSADDGFLEGFGDLLRMIEDNNDQGQTD